MTEKVKKKQKKLVILHFTHLRAHLILRRIHNILNFLRMNTRMSCVVDASGNLLSFDDNAYNQQTSRVCFCCVTTAILGDEFKNIDGALAS